MPEKIAFVRESAKRTFSEEFRAVKFTKKFSDEEKAPTFAILPTGTVANRLLVIGVLTQKEKKEGNATIYRGVVNDNTGKFYVAATSYQPDAMMSMARITTPETVAVIGKPNIYVVENPDKTKRYFASLRVEDIIVVDRETREEWVIDTARATLDRIKVMEANKDPWVSEVQAMYGTDTKAYRAIIKQALDTLFQTTF